MRIGQSAGKDFAYILGVYLGDGCISHTKRQQVSGEKRYPYFQLSVVDLDFADATATALKAITDYAVTRQTVPVKKSPKNPQTFVVICGDPKLCEQLKADTDNKQVIPAYVEGWSQADRLAFIAGLMDSEGFVAQNKRVPPHSGRGFMMGFKSTDPWVPQFVRILEQTGIRVGKVAQEAPRKPGYRTPTRFAIKMASWVDVGGYFNIRRKQERVETWQNATPVPKNWRTRITHCTVDGCENRHLARGLCNKHYHEWRKRRSTSETRMPDAPHAA
jgi:hypothetical protein